MALGKAKRKTGRGGAKRGRYTEGLGQPPLALLPSLRPWVLTTARICPRGTEKADAVLSRLSRLPSPGAGAWGGTVRLIPGFPRLREMLLQMRHQQLGLHLAAFRVQSHHTHEI